MTESNDLNKDNPPNHDASLSELAETEVLAQDKSPDHEKEIELESIDISELEPEQTVDEAYDDALFSTIPASSTSRSDDSHNNFKMIRVFFIALLSFIFFAGVLFWLFHKPSNQLQSNPQEALLQKQPNNQEGLVSSKTIENKTSQNNQLIKSQHINSLLNTATNYAEQHQSVVLPKRVLLKDLILVRPPEEKGSVLNQHQIGWCMYQKIRINELRNLLKQDASIMRLNEQTASYNQYCRNLKYSDVSIKLAQSNLKGHKADIVSLVTKEAKKMDAEAIQLVKEAEKLPKSLVRSNKSQKPLQVSLPQPTLDTVIANNECALVVKRFDSRQSANHYVLSNLSDTQYVNILIMKEGQFAVSLGRLKQNQRHMMAQWQAEGRIAKNSVCLNKSAFIGVLPKPTKKQVLAKQVQSAILNNETLKTDTPTNTLKTDQQVQAIQQNNGYQTTNNNSLNKIQNPAQLTSQNTNNNLGNNQQAVTIPQDDGLSTGYIAVGQLSQEEQQLAENQNQKEIDNLLKNYSSIEAEAKQNISASEFEKQIEVSVDPSTNHTTISNINDSDGKKPAEEDASSGVSIIEGKPIEDETP